MILLDNYKRMNLKPPHADKIDTILKINGLIVGLTYRMSVAGWQTTTWYFCERKFTSNSTFTERVKTKVQVGSKMITLHTDYVEHPPRRNTTWISD